MGNVACWVGVRELRTLLCGCRGQVLLSSCERVRVVCAGKAAWLTGGGPDKV